MNSPVVAILLMLCLVINSFDASPISKDADVEKYSLRIHESGTEFNETVTIDEKQQTELFKVPSHNDVEKSEIMFDFKMNATMIHFPLRSVCFLLPLTRDQPTPKNLVRNLQELTSNDVTTHTETIMVDKEITDRSILSDSTASLCSKSRIFQVAEVPNWRIDVTNIDKAHTRRSRRGAKDLCDDALDYHEVAQCHPYGFTPRCRVEVLSCAWLVDCPGVEPIWFTGGNARSEADRMVSLSTNGDVKNKYRCKINHMRYSFLCCGYYCDKTKRFG